MALYLLHFDRPYKHARHYLGFTLARIWPHGTKDDERKKKQRGHARQCPICTGRDVPPVRPSHA